jgi:hypothetical protein
MFDIDTNNNVIIKEPIILAIKQFKEIWDSDKSKNKSKAYKDLSYLYLRYDFKSPYRNAYTSKELPEVLKRDLDLDSTWEESDILKEAGKKYLDLQTTKSLKVLMAAESALEQITSYFNDFDITVLPEDKKAEAIRKLMSNMKSIDEIVAKLESAKDRVSKELHVSKLSGTKVLGSRELPKNKRK